MSVRAHFPLHSMGVTTAFRGNRRVRRKILPSLTKPPTPLVLLNEFRDGGSHTNREWLSLLKPPQRTENGGYRTLNLLTKLHLVGDSVKVYVHIRPERGEIDSSTEEDTDTSVFEYGGLEEIVLSSTLTRHGIVIIRNVITATANVDVVLQW